MMFTDTDAANHYQQLREQLQQEPRHWLVTGAAGFIGSNLVQALLQLDQQVTGLDNFLTGRRANLQQVEQLVGPARWHNFCLIEGDIRDETSCLRACAGIDYVLHQAALGSVVRSLLEPLLCHSINVDGYLQLLESARRCKVKRLIYASSSATYGDHPELPKRENHCGQALSPYALSKQINEYYASLYQRCFGLECIGLRYFNVFGPRQDPAGAYAAVIPCWIDALQQGRPIVIYGDGETSRDFCYVENVVQANILAALCLRNGASDQVYNIAVGQSTSLRALHLQLQRLLAPAVGDSSPAQPEYREFRVGDVRHSHADISKAGEWLGYQPSHDLARGLQQTVAWYQSQSLLAGN